MSTTISLSVREARKRLADTSRLSPDQINELEQIVARFYGSRPRSRQCVACQGAAVWEERVSKDGDSVWCCGQCGRSASLTSEEWDAQRQAAQAVRRVQDAAAAAAVPEPHAVLRNALTARAESTTALARLESAQVSARSALADALVRQDAASAALDAAEASAGARLAASMLGAKATPAGITVGAGRGQVTAAADALAAARNAKALLDGQLVAARSAANLAEDRVRRAAMRVLSAEQLEILVDSAVNARASYLESITALSWLIRQGVVPNGDVRPNQLVREADTPPSRWPEAAHADGGMAKKLAALMEDKP